MGSRGFTYRIWRTLLFGIHYIIYIHTYLTHLDTRTIRRLLVWIFPLSGSRVLGGMVRRGIYKMTGFSSPDSCLHGEEGGGGGSGGRRVGMGDWSDCMICSMSMRYI